MVTIPENFVYVFPLAYGLIVGIVELFFVHMDEAGLRWMSHGLHALPWCVVFTYASMNVYAVAALLPFSLPQWALLYVLPVVLGLITAFKVKAAAAIAKGGTVGEKFIHALIIGALVAAAPFVFMILQSMNIEALAFIMR